MKCIKCGSYAFNLYKEDIDQGDLCDVHYWQGGALTKVDRHELQTKGEHPAPCARFCEANAFYIQERQLRRRIAELEAQLAQPEQPSPTVGYAKKIESLIAQRDALKAMLAEQGPTNCRHCGGDANTICAGQSRPTLDRQSRSPIIGLGMVCKLTSPSRLKVQHQCGKSHHSASR